MTINSAGFMYAKTNKRHTYRAGSLSVSICRGCVTAALHLPSTFLTMSFTSPRPRLITRRELIRNTSDTCQRGPALKWPWWRFHWVSQPLVDVIHSPVASQIHLSDINPSVKRRGRLLKLARIACGKKKKKCGLDRKCFYILICRADPAGYNLPRSRR